MLVFPAENQLYGVDCSFITDFNPALEQQEISTPLSEIYESMGIRQYMEEIEKKEIVEKLFSKRVDS
jgi:hypothetical protein